jgi:molecular chaperone GrpE
MTAKKKTVKEEMEEEIIDDSIGAEEDISEEVSADELDTDSANDADGESIEDQLAAALKKADDNWDQFLRTKAEMENLRRRNQKDVENAHKYGLEKLINELIPIKEGMELGMAVEDATVDSLHEGMQLTLNMFSTAFDKLAVEEINPVDEKFDPELHQAMTMQPSDDVEPNTVLQVLQKGYRLNDRLIRPAMVIVSKAAE